jgi:hypothetical protein
MPGVFCQLLSQAGAKYVFHKLCVRMKMTRLTLLPLLCILFFGCTENKKAETITYKDIEGYWVSGYLLHNTDLSRSIAAGNAEREQGIQLLRLKNEVNGFADTSYRIHGDTLFYRSEIERSFDFDGNYTEKENFHSFRIIFHSKERLIVTDDVTHKETTFYNISVLPGSNETFKMITYDRDMLKITPDTVYIGYSNISVSRKNILLDKKWSSELKMIIGKVNWNATIFTRELYSYKTKRIGEFDAPSGTRRIGINYFYP